MVLRDEHGLVIASMSLKLPLSYLVDEAEDLVVVRTLEFSLEVGVNRVVPEGESEITMKALTKKKTSLASFGTLIQDVKFISKSFRWLSYTHTRHDQNKIAHNLTRGGLMHPKAKNEIEALYIYIYIFKYDFKILNIT